MSPKGFDPSVLAAWLWWRPSLKAFGAHLRLPSPREVIILCCVLVTLHTVATVARRHIATRPPRRWNLPVRTASAIPYGVPPPGFQAVAPDGRPYTQDSLPSDGPALVAFLTYRCGACDPAVTALEEVAATHPDVGIVWVLSDDGPLEPVESEDWLARKNLQDQCVLDPTGEWALSWIGQRPAFPYVALLDRGRFIWAVTGIAEEDTYEQLLSAWDRAKAATPPDEGRLRKLRVRRDQQDEEAPLVDVASEGLWVLTYGPADADGCVQRRGHLALCRAPDGSALSQAHILTGKAPREMERAERGLDQGLLLTHAPRALGGAPSPWVPYTEIWLDGGVVYAEGLGDSHRDVVMRLLSMVWGE